MKGKIKFQGGLTKLIASEIGKWNKQVFAKDIFSHIQSVKENALKKSINTSLVSFSCSRDYYDQILSILSFIRYVGEPIRWEIYSDGTISKEQIRVLESNFSFLKVNQVNWQNIGHLLKECPDNIREYAGDLLTYAKNHPLGKKLFTYLSHKFYQPTIFLDADILFYEKADSLRHILEEPVNGWYLPDIGFSCLDSRYLSYSKKQMYQVNSGLLIFNSAFTNLKPGLEFLKQLQGKFEYFTEQTVLHILVKENSFMPLDPRIFILNSEDQFDFSYQFPRERMALRHYTGPIRHKMWQRNWKWQLSL